MTASNFLVPFLLCVKTTITVEQLTSSLSVKDFWSKISHLNNLVTRLYAENRKLYSEIEHIHRHANFREYKNFYEANMLNVLLNDKIIHSKKYWDEVALFNNDPAQYLKAHNLDQLVKKETGINPKKISKTLAQWVFILDYLINKAEPDEITHPGLIELKKQVIRNDTSWGGNYVVFAHYLAAAFGMSCDVMHKAKSKVLYTSTTFKIFHLDHLQTPGTMESVLEECMDLFYQVHLKFPIILDLGYTFSESSTRRIE